MREEEFVGFMSLDWADERHAGCLQERGSDLVEEFVLDQKPETIQEWVGQLRGRFKSKKIAVALEQKRGALIYALMKYELFVIFPLNTTAVKNYRKALRASGAKDDPSDARLQLQFLCKHLASLKRFEPESVVTRQLTLLVEGRRKMVDQASALSNQITALLKEYYPAALGMVGHVKTVLACNFLRRWPTLEALKRVNPETLSKFYYKAGSRSTVTIQRRLSVLQRAVPLVEEKPIVNTYRLILLACVSELKALLEAVEVFDQEIEAIFAGHPDFAIYNSLPGAGPAIAPRLAAAFGEDRSKYETATAIQNFSGVAPVTKSSGKWKMVVFRYGAPKFLRQSFIEFARLSMAKSKWASRYYRKCRSTGKSHQAAIRALAYKWIRILFRCWKDRKPYDEAKYIQALAKRNSPLIG